MKFGRLGLLLATLIVVVFALNPETLELALFINAVGFDMYVLLLEIQILAAVGLLLQFYLTPVFRFFLGFSMHTFIIPSWGQIKHDPASIAFAFPPGAILVFLVFAGTIRAVLSCDLFSCF